MLSADTTDRAELESKHHQSAPTAPLPRLCSVKRACFEWGDCGKTRFYEIVRDHEVELVKIGSKTVVAGEDVNRVADAFLAAARKAKFEARALAPKAVMASKRHETAPRASISPTTEQRRRRGSTNPELTKGHPSGSPS